MEEKESVTKILNVELKANKIKKMYFFLGEETFLSNFYIEAIKKKLNCDEEFDFVKFDAEYTSGFQEAVETPPMLSEKKLVVVKGIDLSAEIKDSELELILEIINQIPEYTCVIFSCMKINKKSRLYEALKKNCDIYLFDYQKPREIINWIVKRCRAMGIQISADTAAWLIEHTGLDMTKIINETDKILSYCQNTVITNEDIDAIVTKTVENKVWDMLDAIMDKKRDTAINVFNELKLEKEEPVAINGAINSTLINIMEYKALKNEGNSPSAISTKMGLKPYTQKKLARYSEKMSMSYLKKMISRCSEFDIAVKSGETEKYTGLNILIMEMMQ